METAGASATKPNYLQAVCGLLRLNEGELDRTAAQHEVGLTSSMKTLLLGILVFDSVVERDLNFARNVLKHLDDLARQMKPL